MNVIFFDLPSLKTSLLPLTLTRPIAHFRVGIFTIAEKWNIYLKTEFSYLNEKYLSEKYPTHIDNQNLWLNGAVCPSESLLTAIENLPKNQVLVKNNIPLAVKTEKITYPTDFWNLLPTLSTKAFTDELNLVLQRQDIFLLNDKEIKSDIELLKKIGLKSQPISDAFTRVYAPENVFVAEGANIKAAILNAETGPIYIGKNAEVQEGAMIRGSFALGENSVVGMGAKMRGSVSIGPFSKVGGEISSSVIFGYSNKGHDGFMGHSVLGEWCNLGADTNTSNLKNNYGQVKVWDFETQKLTNSGLQFYGLVMGDHSKAGINTMFNTGTVVGVSSNVFGGSFPPKYVPSFAWGGQDSIRFDFEKAIETAQRVMSRRGIILNESDKNILKYIANQQVYVSIPSNLSE
jgi:UDP-N-acetylglucosamine diphosphorylase/glucosamine-1-phosphate N-acetyltransferase